MRDDDERETYGRRFQERAALFLDALRALAARAVRWSDFVSEFELSQTTDEVAFRAKLRGESPLSADSADSVVAFCKGQIDDGFSVVVGAVYKPSGSELHVLSWEGDEEAEWPPALRPAVTLRWEPVTNLNELIRST